MGQENSVSKGGTRFHSGGIRVGEVRGGGVTVLWQGVSSKSESCQEL